MKTASVIRAHPFLKSMLMVRAFQSRSSTRMRAKSQSARRRS